MNIILFRINKNKDEEEKMTKKIYFDDKELYILKGDLIRICRLLENTGLVEIGRAELKNVIKNLTEKRLLHKTYNQVVTTE